MGGDHAQSSSLRDGRRPRLRFLNLPLEIRWLIYKHLLLVDWAIDLNPTNRSQIARRLLIFRVCRQIHQEAYPIFYGLNTFRIFPTHGKYWRKRRVLLSRLSVRYRTVMTRLELRLGPSWSSPPPAWRVDDKLGLSDARSVHTLSIFVECDPSNPVFSGFRQGKHFYTSFAAGLLQDLLAALPLVQRIAFDAYPSVKIQDELMSRLILETTRTQRSIGFSSTLRNQKIQTEEDVLISLASLDLNL